jgi:pyruvate/2-oxoacid:ferredoxin oxidoreductase alpha subunit
MEFSFAEGLCLTPVCVTTDGNHCSEQYTPVEENAKPVEEIFGAEAVAKYEEAKPPPPPPPPASKKKKSKKISWKKILG